MSYVQTVQTKNTSCHLNFPAALHPTHPAPILSPPGCFDRRGGTLWCPILSPAFTGISMWPVTIQEMQPEQSLNISHSSFRNTQLLLSLEGRACINSKRSETTSSLTLPSVMEMLLLLWLQTVLLNYWMVSQCLSLCLCVRLFPCSQYVASTRVVKVRKMTSNKSNGAQGDCKSIIDIQMLCSTTYFILHSFLNILL